MKLISAKVDWMEGFANKPNLILTVDHIPKRDNMRFRQSGNFYYAELEGYVTFFYYERPGAGYGGSTFSLKMVDGTTKSLIGPWSSRAGSLNTVFGPCVDVTIIEESNGYRMAGAVTLEVAEKAAEMAGARLQRVVDQGDIRYDPVKR